ncbi:hypothetical protein N7508_000333 [Penicillium antarcticum]|uniref:uncharacterized protein n=1 Tax=Penicillium antarcticum TaxID=416450 RepID=UPI0023900AAB|nr:uncharacterized protein N7508_000333 [Penicillium antarcticum]KAJ5320050.1 hypothetical protein N7508_000333 [Penicillium antarcticum]
MSTFVRKAEKAITSEQPNRDSSFNHETHTPDLDPGNKADTEMTSGKGVTAIDTETIVAQKLTCLETHEANSSSFAGDAHHDLVRHYGSKEDTGLHGSKIANKLDPRVDPNSNIPGWMIV